ncbi:MAG: radical SAM protein, partial [Clostridia bacterium]|nr:radical SAM protein [Clostridia bacterium]
MNKKRVCWNITAKCNQNCKYCHRFLNINDLTYEENKTILNNLIKDGIDNITWTGGEALLYPNLKELLKIAQENGIKNKLITNGLVLAQNQDAREIIDYLDSLTLSLDT